MFRKNNIVQLFMKMTEIKNLLHIEFHVGEFMISTLILM